MTSETRQAIEDTGRVLHDAGRAMIVSSHMMSRATAHELLGRLTAVLIDLQQKVDYDAEIHHD